MRKNIFTKATMRRAAAFGLAGCMAAASLTGCGSSKTESTTAANAETKVEAEGESKAEAADGSDIHVGIIFTEAGLSGNSFNDLALEGVKKAADSCQLPVSCVATLSAICAYSSALVGIVFCPPFSFGVKRRGGKSPPHPCGYVVYWSKSGYSSSSANFSSVIAQSFVRALSVSSLSSVSSGESSPRISRRLSISPVRLPVL